MWMILAFAAQQPADTRPNVNTTPLMRAAQVRDPSQPDGPLARFTDLPNVTVTYYEVGGRAIPEIHKAVAKAAPHDPETNRALPATSSWSVGVKVLSLTTGKVCRVTGVTLDFRARALMPRLSEDKERPPVVAASWNNYVARLEARQVAQLRFAYDRMGEVEQAVLASRCDKAEAAADAALARLQERQRLVFSQDSKGQPRLEEPLDGA